MQKSPDAFRTISEVAEELDLPQHVLRFWETRFSSIRPLKRGGGRRYYRPDDVDLLKGIRHLLYGQGYTIKGVQRILREQGLRTVQALGRGERPALAMVHEPSDDEGDLAPEGYLAPEGDLAPQGYLAPEGDLAPEEDHTPEKVRTEISAPRPNEDAADDDASDDERLDAAGGDAAAAGRLPGGIRRDMDAGRLGGGLAGDDIAHLRGVLDELLECERILGSLQAE